MSSAKWSPVGLHINYILGKQTFATRIARDARYKVYIVNKGSGSLTMDFCALYVLFDPKYCIHLH